jgi:shikimate dehydrogenase
MHNAAFRSCQIDAVYLALGIAPEHLKAAVEGLRSMGALGASITVPHKSAVISCCDELSERARAIGAVNTLEFRGGKIRGHNTDAGGYLRSFHEAFGEGLTGKRVVLLGGGGAARAIYVAAQDEGAASIDVVVRSPAKVDWAKALPWQPAELKCLANCDVLVDCTSIGLDALRERSMPCDIPLQLMPPNAVVSTLVYHRETALLAQAKRTNLRTLDGLGMLLFQGVLAFELWTGQDAPVEAMRDALTDASHCNRIDTMRNQGL